MAIMGPQFAAQPAKNRVDLAQQMIARDHIFEVELIEKTLLPTYRLTHHRRDLLLKPSQARNHTAPSRTKDFFDSLSQKETFAGVEISSTQGPESTHNGHSS